MDNITTMYKIGDIVPYRFTWYWVLVSYFVSLVGSETTVELLHRRRPGNGWLSWLQLGACSVSFGLVAIWCMHFTGNRAIQLGDNKVEIQLYYNQAWTALSAIMPIIFLFGGFTTAERFNRTKRSLYLSLIVTGLAAGLSITGMHYIGNFGTSNYDLENSNKHIIGAASIAVVACWFSFTIFFHQREHWINYWWRRFLCACLLAGAVSGMHWTASIGTTYKLRSYHTTGTFERERNLIVAVVLSLITSLLCVALAFVGQRRRRQLADRAQHVVLASATFDPEGRLLVTPQGLMPCQKITRQYNQRSFNDEFNVAHPVFQWIYRITHHWSGVSELVPAMRSHLRATGTIKSRSVSRPDTSGRSSPFEEVAGGEDYSAIFREQFCVAASELAEQLDTEMQKLGVLYEEILMTGTQVVHDIVGRKAKPSGDLTQDIESGLVIPALFGKGQLLFVARRIDRAEAGRLIDQGYKFAQADKPADKVSEILAKSMQVKKQDIVDTVVKLRDYCNRGEGMKGPSTYLACFCIRPALKNHNGGWDILVPKSNPDQLPSIVLTPDVLTSAQTELVQGLDGYSLGQCLQHLSKKAADHSPYENESEFSQLLLKKMVTLADMVPEPFFRQSVFSAIPIKGAEGVKPANILAFCIIPDVHLSNVKVAETLQFLPFSFFKCRQRVKSNSPDHGILARRNHREFGNIMARDKKDISITVNKTSGASTPVSSPRSPFWRPWSRPPNSTVDSVHQDNSSEKELVRESSQDNITIPFGGIMVSQDIVVNTSGAKDGSDIELRDLGVVSEASRGEIEQPTFADVLYKITCAKWQKS